MIDTFGHHSTSKTSAITRLEQRPSAGVMFYNWCRKHETMKMTPAQAAGLSECRLTVKDMLYLECGAAQTFCNHMTFGQLID